jgi:hypothetical protein
MNSAHKMAHTTIDGFSNTKEALLSGVEPAMINAAMGDSAVGLLKLMSPQDARVVGAAILTIDDTFIEKKMGDIFEDEHHAEKHRGALPINTEFLSLTGLAVVDVVWKIDDIDLANDADIDAVEEDMSLFIKKVNDAPQWLGFSVERMDKFVPNWELDTMSIESVSSHLEIPFHGVAGIAAAYRLSCKLPSGIGLAELCELLPEDARQAFLRSDLIETVSRLHSAENTCGSVLDLLLVGASRGMTEVDDLVTLTKASEASLDNQYLGVKKV